MKANSKMNFLYSLVVVTGLVCAVSATRHECSAELNINSRTATKAQLRLAAGTLETRNLDDFTIHAMTADQNKKAYDKMKGLKSNEERRNTALCLFYSAIAECKKKHLDCKLCELVFIAHAMATADEQCYFICTEALASAKVHELPTRKTFETYLKSGMGMKEDGATEDELKALVKEGMKQTGLDVNDKRFASLAVLLFVMAAKFVVFVASNVAIGYITENSSDEYGVQTLNNEILGPLSDVASAGGGCFFDSTVVNVYHSGRQQIIPKQLKHVEVGDMVESVDEITGKRIFSPVYYIAHQNNDIKAELLNVYYKNEGQTKRIGLSRRHLIYASKGNQTNAPLNEPIRADAVKNGDHVWVMESSGLVAKEVIDVIPFYGGVRHPLTQNHHIVVDGVHASVHVLNENLYRGLTSPLRLTYWLNPEWNNGGIVNKLVRLVESIKEPVFNDDLAKVIGQFSVIGASVM